MKNRFMLKFAVAAIVKVVAVFSHGSVIDQNTLLPQPDPSDGYMSGIPVRQTYQAAQTFEVGITGTLDSIDLQFFFLENSGPDEALEFAVVELGPDGFPSEQVLGTSSLSANFDTTLDRHYLLSLDFSGQNVSLASGTSYALVPNVSALTDPAIWGLWLFAVGDFDSPPVTDRYDGGSGIFWSGSEWINPDVVQPSSAFDLAFATYMTPVPVPHAAVLLVSSLLFLRRVAT